MSSIDSLLNIVVFLALFSSSGIFVDSATGNGLNPRRMDFRIIYNPIQDANSSYVKLKAKLSETIDIPVVCPQSKELQYVLIYKVESREEFDKCANKSEINEYRIVGVFDCQGSKPSQTAKLAVNVNVNFADYPPKPNAIEIEKRDKEYFFISVTYGPENTLDRLCDGFYILFSVTVDIRERLNQIHGRNLFFTMFDNQD